ncbi:hypothetical protein EVAR_99609_1 [Eumeta japonica]|uniref:Uncharacterized protein n=1 Tax=Eumeta variegata TaxID=151549 RepID=A0A4C1SUX8_EUMVA|nr:hypothetical protein EVAR_99609_1 [Eumeta japonica]
MSVRRAAVQDNVPLRWSGVPRPTVVINGPSGSELTLIRRNVISTIDGCFIRNGHGEHKLTYGRGRTAFNNESKSLEVGVRSAIVGRYIDRWERKWLCLPAGGGA